MIVESVGGSWGPQAHKVWASLAKSMAQATGEQEDVMANRIFQNLGLILQRENARAIIRRSVATAAIDRPILSAFAAIAAADAAPAV